MGTLYPAVPRGAPCDIFVVMDICLARAGGHEERGGVVVLFSAPTAVDLFIITRRFRRFNPRPERQRTIKRPHLVAALLAAFTLIIQPSAQADTFGSGPNTFTIDFVNIGNAGNAADTTGYGAVPYKYRASIYEISENDIAKASVSGMANVTAGAWTGNKPAANINWYEAAAFVNFLNTSTGKTAAYDLTFSNSQWSMALWSSEQAWTAGGTNLYRNKNATYFLPSENEWYKAAYYNPAGSNYFLYPTASNTPPTAVASGTNAGSAVYGSAALVPAIVDTAGGLSPYGTMGQGGNVWDWTESAYAGTNSSSSEIRAFRGGYWLLAEGSLRSSYRDFAGPAYESVNLGFRVASVPESSSVLWSSAGGSAWLTATNWTGGAVPFSADIAQFGANPTSGATPVGIDMGSNGGAQSVGAIEVLSDRSAALIIANSSASAAGTLTLLGATVNSTNNVVLRNNSAQLLTLADGATRTMGVVLGNAANNVVVIDGTGGITISSSISGSGRQLTKSGIGDGFLTLSGANTFSGATTVSAGTLRLNSVSSALGSTASVSVASGATLLISLSNQVNNSATVTLSGGTITRGSGVTEVFGSLNLDQASFLDFGTGTAGNLTFGTYTPSSLLTINSFTQGNTLVFGSDLRSTINNSSFFTFTNGGIGSSSWNGSTFTITAIPEPSTYVAAIALLALMLWPLRHRLRGKVP